MAGACEGTGQAPAVFYSMDEPLRNHLHGALAEFKLQVEATWETPSAV